MTTTTITEEHRRALELAAMPTLALIVAETGRAADFGEMMRVAIDRLLGIGASNTTGDTSLIEIKASGDKLQLHINGNVSISGVIDHLNGAA